MSVRRYKESRIEAMGEVLGQRIYHARFEHAESAQRLVSLALAPLLSARPANQPLSILDCGCGAGPWLEFLAGVAPGRSCDRLYGFDMTPALVELAQKRMADRGVAALIANGDILDPSAYRAADGRTHYDIVFTYDVIQQLPRELQLLAVQRMLEHVAPGGAAIVVDCDLLTAFGLRMAIRKWITRYLRLPLVPRFYLVARYPRFGAMIRTARRQGKYCRTLTQSGSTRKALVILPGPP